ncbi:hypothetical protein AB0I91_31665, partial [Actinosynnema sp. NPDC049800]
MAASRHAPQQSGRRAVAGTQSTAIRQPARRAAGVLGGQVARRVAVGRTSSAADPGRTRVRPMPNGRNAARASGSTRSGSH